MFYVYRLESLRFPGRVYVGYTENLRQRLTAHNAGCCDYTRPFRPWKVSFYAAFDDQGKAVEFERYLKTGSGIAFGRKRLWMAGPKKSQLEGEGCPPKL